jgi:serine/threonine-protein kinase
MRPQDPFIGRDILNGQFQILQKIGTGGMGSVYKALQPEMNRMVGVKILHPKLTNRKDLVSRFRREARAMSHLTHPNTVKVFLYGELEDGSLYIVMEFLDGKNLNQTVRAEGPMPMERALPILIQVCGALEEAHRAGIIHRDLKPENIFLCQQGGFKDYPKVLDFGLAKVTEREMRPGSLILTQEGMVFGTPEFMSPEQAQGKVLTAASDIYSLATILYEVLTGKLPFEAKGAMDFLQLHVSGKPIALSKRVEGRTFPPLLDQVIERALAKKTEDRFASAADFASALQAVLDGKLELPANLLPAPTNGAAAAGTVGSAPSDSLPSAPASGPISGSPMSSPPVASSRTSLRAGAGARASKDASTIPDPPKKKNPVLLLSGVALGCLFVGAAIAVVFMRYFMGH